MINTFHDVCSCKEGSLKSRVPPSVDLIVVVRENVLIILKFCPGRAEDDSLLTLSSAAMTPPPLPPPLYSMAQMLPTRLCTNFRLNRVSTFHSEHVSTSVGIPDRPEALFGRGDERLGDLLAARRADEEAEVDAPAHLVAHQLVESAGEARKTVVLK